MWVCDALRVESVVSEKKSKWNKENRVKPMVSIGLMWPLIATGPTVVE